MTQLLLPKARCENAEQETHQEPEIVNVNFLYDGLSCLTDSSNPLLTANLNSLAQSGKTELTTSYIQRSNTFD